MWEIFIYLKAWLIFICIKYIYFTIYIYFNMEAKNQHYLQVASTNKSFNAQLAVDYPAYSMVICQVLDKLKLVLLFAAQYLVEWVKTTCLLRLCVCSAIYESNVLVSAHQLKHCINIERWLNWLGTTCALNGFNAYEEFNLLTVPVSVINFGIMGKSRPND